MHTTPAPKAPATRCAGVFQNGRSDLAPYGCCHLDGISQAKAWAMFSWPFGRIRYPAGLMASSDAPLEDGKTAFPGEARATREGW